MLKYHFSLILSTTLCFLFLASCEKASIQTTRGEIKDNNIISTRTVDDCDDCPNNDDCCCGVWLQNNNYPATLRFCGTTDGPNSCTGTYSGPCYSFSGGGQDIALTSSPFREGFCVAPNTSFWVQNISHTVYAYIYLTCQHDLLAAQILPVTLAPGEAIYFAADGSCELLTCPQ